MAHLHGAVGRDLDTWVSQLQIERKKEKKLDQQYSLHEKKEVVLLYRLDNTVKGRSRLASLYK